MSYDELLQWVLDRHPCACGKPRHSFLDPHCFDCETKALHWLEKGLFGEDP